MSQVKIQGNASGNGTLTIAAPNTSTDYTLTLPTNTGTILTSASTFSQNSGPAFSAYATGGGNQFAFSANTWTKVELNAEEFDTDNCFDSSTNYRFTPTVAGYYQISGAAYHDYSSAAAGSIQTSIYKNGSNYGFSRDLQPTASYNYGSHPISRVVYLNGSTDYIELYVYSTNSSPYLNIGSVYSTWLSGVLVRAA